MELNEISGRAVHTAIRIHSKLGPGLLEHVYEIVLARDLARQGLHVQRQEPVSFDFEGLWFADAGRVDLIVEQALIIEVKSLATITAVHQKQVLTYLRLLDFRLGLLFNFGAALMKDGIHRIANNI